MPPFLPATLNRLGLKQKPWVGDLAGAGFRQVVAEYLAGRPFWQKEPDQIGFNSSALAAPTCIGATLDRCWPRDSKTTQRQGPC